MNQWFPWGVSGWCSCAYAKALAETTLLLSEFERRGEERKCKTNRPGAGRDGLF